jgi:uncharacterized protein with GYD domain
MPTFISLVEYTAEGVQQMEGRPDRLDAARDRVESMGGELTQFFLTMGDYDAVAVMELPNAETATQAAITIAGAGAVRTETMRAFPEDDYRELIEGLP